VSDHGAGLAAVLDALAADRPAAAARAAGWLDGAFADIRASRCPEYAWRAGVLTGDGYPAEFTFTSADDDIRCTVEPWPDVAADGRLTRALALASAPDAKLNGQPNTELDDELRALQPRGARLMFGAWVGARFGADPARDRCKVYVEIAPGAEPTGGPGFGDLACEARIEAVEPASGRRERYYRGRDVKPHHLARLLDGAGLGDRLGELRECVEHAYGRPIDGALPGGAAGWSIARAPGQAPVLTVFLFARALWGGDARIVKRADEFCAWSGRALIGYAAAVAGLPPSAGACTWHGMVGFTVAPGQPVHLALGLRPATVRSRVAR
jgi:hypothetical protein